MPDSQMQKCEKHGIWPCGICHREALKLAHKPLVAREDSCRGRKNDGDDERFVVVYFKNINRLGDIAPASATHIHFAGSCLCVPSAEKLLAYFKNLSVVNLSPSQGEECSKRLADFLSARGVTLTFDYVRAKGGRLKAREGREDSRWRNGRATMLRLAPEAKEKLAELIRLKIPEAILFQRYYQLDCPEKSRMTLMDVATSLGCLTSSIGRRAIRAVYFYIVNEHTNDINIYRAMRSIARRAAKAKETREASA